MDVYPKRCSEGYGKNAGCRRYLHDQSSAAASFDPAPASASALPPSRDRQHDSSFTQESSIAQDSHAHGPGQRRAAEVESHARLSPLVDPAAPAAAASIGQRGFDRQRPRGDTTDDAATLFDDLHSPEEPGDPLGGSAVDAGTGHGPGRTERQDDRTHDHDGEGGHEIEAVQEAGEYPWTGRGERRPNRTRGPTRQKR